jgi:hypothetical protein
MLGDGLCDTWVAFDVLCCTASILNLAAISFDRYVHTLRNFIFPDKPVGPARRKTRSDSVPETEAFISLVREESRNAAAERRRVHTCSLFDARSRLTKKTRLVGLSISTRRALGSLLRPLLRCCFWRQQNAFRVTSVIWQEMRS